MPASRRPGPSLRGGDRRGKDSCPVRDANLALGTAAREVERKASSSDQTDGAANRQPTMLSGKAGARPGAHRRRGRVPRLIDIAAGGYFAGPGDFARPRSSLSFRHFPWPILHCFLSVWIPSQRAAGGERVQEGQRRGGRHAASRPARRHWELRPPPVPPTDD